MKVYLDKNEMPHTPPEYILNSIRESIKHINRYTPQKRVDTLRNFLAEYNEIDKKYFFLSPGSDILIKEFVFLYSKIDQIIIPDPTFIIIDNAVEKTTSSILKIKLSPPDFKFPYNFISSELEEPTLIILDNPNNPTGKLIIDTNGIKKLLQHENVFVLIDEAYYEFSKKTAIKLIEKYPNLAILRTLSKSFGLAGSGIGYMIAGEKIIEKFRGLEIMLPYPSVVAAISALKNTDYLKDYLKEIETEKKRIYKKLSELSIEIYSSKTNFLLINTRIPDIIKKLTEKGVYVYDASNYFSSGYLRVTIGTEKENNYFIHVLENIINNK